MSKIKEVSSYGTEVVSWWASMAFFECPHCEKAARVFVSRSTNMFGRFGGTVVECDKCKGEVRLK